MTKLKRSLDKILRDWGHNIVLQRRGDDGYLDRFERHTVRHMYPSTRGLPKVREEEPEGIVSVVDMIYFFRADVRPKEGDRIYEEDVGNGQSTFIIDYALPMRGRGGNIVYFECGVTREEPN